MGLKLTLRVILATLFFLIMDSINSRLGAGLMPEAQFSDNLSGYEIAKNSHERYIANDESTELWMLLINSRGQMRIRKLLRFRKSFPDHKRVVLKFIHPEDIRDTGFLNEEKPKEKYDTQFLYLPAIKKLRRISAANKEQRWVGSDFFYEDIQEIKLNDWDYRRLDDDIFDDFPCYVVEWLPKQNTETVYGKEIYWYRKEGYLSVRIDYYDKNGNLWKRATAYDLRYNQEVWVAWRLKIEDFDANHKTELYRRWIFFDTKLPDDYFTTRSIEKNVSSYTHPVNLWEMISSSSEYDGKIKNP